jgi:integrase
VATSRFAINPLWLIYLPPETSIRPGLLERPVWALASFVKRDTQRRVHERVFSVPKPDCYQRIRPQMGIDPFQQAAEQRLVVGLPMISGSSADMARLLKWLRETGMRLAEALHIEAADIHPCGTKATLRRGVKRNSVPQRCGPSIWATRPPYCPCSLGSGRLFPGPSTDSAVVSTRYGQWQRQENRAAEEEGRGPRELRRFRIHDLRHAFAIASLIDDSTCIYRHQQHLGHSSVIGYSDTGN